MLQVVTLLFLSTINKLLGKTRLFFIVLKLAQLVSFDLALKLEN